MPRYFDNFSRDIAQGQGLGAYADNETTWTQITGRPTRVGVVANDGAKITFAAADSTSISYRLRFKAGPDQSSTQQDVLMLVQLTARGAVFGPTFRENGTSAAAVAIQISLGGVSISIHVLNATSTVILASAVALSGIAAGDWVWVRGRLSPSGTSATIYGKCWKFGTAEPSTWQRSVSTTSAPASGTPGFFVQHNEATDKNFHVRFFQASLGDPIADNDAVPYPVRDTMSYWASEGFGKTSQSGHIWSGHVGHRPEDYADDAYQYAHGPDSPGFGGGTAGYYYIDSKAEARSGFVYGITGYDTINLPQKAKLRFYSFHTDNRTAVGVYGAEMFPSGYGRLSRGYFAELLIGRNTVEIYRINSNYTHTLIASGVLPFTLGVNQWTNLLIYAGQGTVRAKAWQGSYTSEPTTWNAIAQDTTYTNGRPFFGQRQFDNNFHQQVIDNFDADAGSHLEIFIYGAASFTVSSNMTANPRRLRRAAFAGSIASQLAASPKRERISAFSGDVQATIAASPELVRAADTALSADTDAAVLPWVVRDGAWDGSGLTDCQAIPTRIQTAASDDIAGQSTLAALSARLSTTTVSLAADATILADAIAGATQQGRAQLSAETDLVAMGFVKEAITGDAQLQSLSDVIAAPVAQFVGDATITAQTAQNVTMLRIRGGQFVGTAASTQQSQAVLTAARSWHAAADLTAAPASWTRDRATQSTLAAFSELDPGAGKAIRQFAAAMVAEAAVEARPQRKTTAAAHAFLGSDLQIDAFAVTRRGEAILQGSSVFTADPSGLMTTTVSLMGETQLEGSAGRLPWFQALLLADGLVVANGGVHRRDSSTLAAMSDTVVVPSRLRPALVDLVADIAASVSGGAHKPDQANWSAMAQLDEITPSVARTTTIVIAAAGGFDLQPPVAQRQAHFDATIATDILAVPIGIIPFASQFVATSSLDGLPQIDACGSSDLAGTTNSVVVPNRLRQSQVDLSASASLRGEPTRHATSLARFELQLTSLATSHRDRASAASGWITTDSEAVPSRQRHGIAEWAAETGLSFLPKRFAGGSADLAGVSQLQATTGKLVTSRSGLTATTDLTAVPSRRTHLVVNLRGDSDSLADAIAQLVSQAALGGGTQIGAIPAALRQSMAHLITDGVVRAYATTIVSGQAAIFAALTTDLGPPLIMRLAQAQCLIESDSHIDGSVAAVGQVLLTNDTQIAIQAILSRGSFADLVIASQLIADSRVWSTIGLTDYVAHHLEAEHHLESLMGSLLVSLGAGYHLEPLPPGHKLESQSARIHLQQLDPVEE